MKECRRRFRTNSSGQLLIVAALAIAILISSTMIYIYEVSKETSITNSYPASEVILALKQSTINTMISSLANITRGSPKAVLEANLNNLSQVFGNLRQLGISYLSFNVHNDSQYSSGVCLSWDTNGSGISSAYVNFILNVQSMAANIALDYPVNITTAVTVDGSYTTLEGEDKLVNLTCRVSNEEGAALAESIALFYDSLGNWIPVNSSNNLSMVDYGNGTYSLSFIVSASTPLQVSAQVHDLRDIFVQANMTCNEA